MENTIENDSIQVKEIKEKDTTIKITCIYSGNDKRNKFKLKMNKETTLHKTAKSVADEIQYHLNELTKQ